jgi:hypothetical protein
LNGQFSDKDNKFFSYQPQSAPDDESASTKDIWSDILAGVTSALASRMSQVAPSGPTSPPAGANVNGNSGNVAVVLYSLSELILTVGFQQTKLFIRRLTDALLQQQHQQGVPATSTTAVSTTSTTSNTSANTNGSSSGTSHAPCLILSVHQSLHSAEVNAQIQALASVLVRVVPNSGTLAETVVAEIQTVRR